VHWLEIGFPNPGRGTVEHTVSWVSPGITSATPSLALLLVAPILLLGADYVFDEILKVDSRLNSARHYRAFLYLSVIAISLIVISQTRSTNSYLEAFRVTSESLIGILIAVLMAFFMGKWILQRSWKVRDREHIERIELELPQYLEMFHILITSGMSVLSALKSLSGTAELNRTSPSFGSRRRDGTGHRDVTGRTDGTEKADPFAWSKQSERSQRSLSKKQSVMRNVVRHIVTKVESGLSIEKALDEVVLDVGSEQLRRFSDAVILGMERGSSMSQTLRNLINETRNQSKILVMQRAGKAEVQLLIPVVFLILPISVMFAIWPSYVNLSSILGG
jgi:pilus assembly protein TadC